MKTKTDIINETIEYYKTHKRGVNKGTCFYYRDDVMCAVGRCMLYPERFGESSAISVIFKRSNELDGALKPEYREHDISFWRDLQLFHDYFDNWVSNGNKNKLSKNGKLRYNELIERYK